MLHLVFGKPFRTLTLWLTPVAPRPSATSRGHRCSRDEEGWVLTSSATDALQALWGFG